MRTKGLSSAGFVLAVLMVPGRDLVPQASPQSGYFRVEVRQGSWWLIDPAGLPTLSVGVDQIAYEPDKIRGTGPSPYRQALERIYRDRTAWGTATLARLRTWGFNTIGAWSDTELWSRDVPYTVILDIGEEAGAHWQSGKPLDVYDPKFEKTAHQIAAKQCAPRAHDRLLVGYFSDNELRWGADWRGKETLLEMYLKLRAGSPGRVQAIEFLRGRYLNEIRKLNEAWGVEVKEFDQLVAPGETAAYAADAEAFLEKVATRYFDVCARAIKAADPNHLYLGARFAGKVGDAVLRAARILDVVSVNIYAFDPRPTVAHIARLTGRPILVGEFSFRGDDAGLPNTKGAGPRVPGQQARAKAYREYVEWLLSQPEVIGYHWFKWADQPEEGRFDGENSNYGLVDINDKPYPELVEVVRATNAQAVEIHGKPAS